MRGRSRRSRERIAHRKAGELQPRRSATEPRRIVMLAFPDVQILDITGPLEVFNVATRLLESGAGGRGRSTGYTTEIAAMRGGAIRTSGGIELLASCDVRAVRGPIDTLMVPGGLGARSVVSETTLVDWIRKAAARSRRVASVCTGTLLLAEAGLTAGHRVTTHWAFAGELARRYPDTTVDPDPVYLNDRGLYSSAGVTAGMDLALALVEEDHGRDLALLVARWLVLFLKRPGGQSQFSTHLSAQTAERKPLRDLQTWIAENLASDLTVERLAARVAMSARNFARVFTRETGVTPARFVERARVEAARRKLEDTGDSTEEIARDSGFGAAETMRRAFLRNVKVAPADYRARFQRANVA